MPDSRDFVKIAKTLKEIRGAESIEKFARAINVTRNYVSMWEHGHRSPSHHVIDRIAAYKRLSSEQHNDLLEIAHYKKQPELTAEEAIAGTINALKLSERETGLLVGEIRAYAVRWKELRQRRNRDVVKAIIPAAGFRASLLAPARWEATILHAAQEAVKGGIRELVIVIAPTKELPEFKTIKALTLPNSGANVLVRTVVQEEPRGLGDAILTARFVVGDEPFAVVLTVDVNPGQAILKNMIRCYREVERPIVGVSRLKLGKAEVQRYGQAVLDEEQVEEVAASKDAALQRLRYVATMVEKPAEAAVGNLSRIIMGRYILTPDIFDVLQATEKNSQTGRLEITDAFNELLKRNHRICAYDFPSPRSAPDETILPTASIRALMEILFESISKPKRLSEIIAVTRKALEQIAVDEPNPRHAVEPLVSSRRRRS